MPGAFGGCETNQRVDVGRVASAPRSQRPTSSLKAVSVSRDEAAGPTLPERARLERYGKALQPYARVILRYLEMRNEPISLRFLRQLAERERCDVANPDGEHIKNDPLDSVADVTAIKDIGDVRQRPGHATGSDLGYRATTGDLSWNLDPNILTHKSPCEPFRRWTAPSRDCR